jgi:hypothetical protein
MKVGNFVEWDSSGGVARGKITQIVKDGVVPGIDAKITGTPEDPAAKIQVYRENSDDEYEATDVYVGHKLTELRSSKSMSEELYQEGEFNTRQRMLVSSLLEVTHDAGKFNKSTDANGAHYMEPSANPFSKNGIACENCYFYQQSGVCALVEGQVEEYGVCKFWIIPEELMTTEMTDETEESYSMESYASFAGINFSPPSAVRAAAKRGLELHEKGLSGDGLEPATVLWARKYSEGQPVSPERARMGNRFYGRNSRFKDAPKDSPAWVSYLLWGGNAGKSWFSSLVSQMDSSKKKSNSETKEKMNIKNFNEHSVASMPGKMTFAQDSTNPLLKSVELILTDFEANANKEGIPLSEVENIIRTAKFTPLKIAMSEDSYAGHKGAIPIGPITEVWQDTHEGKPVIKAKAVIWSDEFKDVYSLLKTEAGERQYIGTSWEVYYQTADEVDGTNWLKNVTFAGTCIVDAPAYGERTKLLKVAEKQKMEELQKQFEELQKTLTEKEKQLDAIRQENDAYKAEANGRAEATKRQEVTNRLVAAGFTQAQITERLDMYLQLPEDTFNSIVTDFAAKHTQSSTKPVNIPEPTRGSDSNLKDPKVLASELKKLLNRGK